MASLTKASSNGQLENLMQCSICLETFKEPRTLPCFHSFCKCCLERYIKAQSRKKSGQSSHCPVCLSEFTLNQQGVSGMTPNHFICNMLEVMNIQRQVKPVPCNHCQEPSVGRCVTCELFMCEECFQPHNSYPGFRNHCVLSMEELSKPENQSKIKGRSHCKEHGDKKLKFYCETCEQLICRYCMDFDHLRPDHVCVPLEKAAENQRESLMMICANLDRKLNKGNETLKELTCIAQSLEKKYINAKQKIHDRKNKTLKLLQLTLDKQAQALIDEARATFDLKKQNINYRINEAQAYVGKVKGSADICSSVLANGNDEEIVQSRNAVKANVLTTTEEEFLNDDASIFDNEVLSYNTEQIDTKFLDDVKTIQGTKPGEDKFLPNTNSSDARCSGVWGRIDYRKSDSTNEMDKPNKDMRPLKRPNRERLVYNPEIGKLRLHSVYENCDNAIDVAMAASGFWCFESDDPQRKAS